VDASAPLRRTILPPEIWPTLAEKWRSVESAVRRLHSQQRAVLVGTRDVQSSLWLSRQLAASGLPHSVLNAHEEAREAAIVARAGQPGAVTIATNMAGRGTDIALGPGVGAAGGLHVIATELYDSARVDRQLAGRCARQGDPGSYQQMLSLEDAILEMAHGANAAKIQQSARQWTTSRQLRVLRRAQQCVEQQRRLGRQRLRQAESHRQQRGQSLGYDPFLDDLAAA
jgi:preprotein translocase subunit SecA